MSTVATEYLAETRETGTRYSGSEWIERQPYGKAISPLGRRVADLLGDLFLGIYHIDSDVRRVDWSNTHHLKLTTYAKGGQFATYDGCLLTRLVILAHDRCLRVEIEPAGPKYLRLTFHGRSRESAEQWGRHPTIEDAIAAHRKHFRPADAA